jgi:hypothetical protein
MEKVIENLLSDYSNWRSTKSAKNARIPNDLIQKTIEVNNQFPKAKLKSLLNLSVPTWKKITSQISAAEGKKQSLSGETTKSKKITSKFLKFDGLEPSFTAQNIDDHFVNKTPVLVMSINNVHIQIFG